MKLLYLLAIILLIAVGCHSSKTSSVKEDLPKEVSQDTVRIANDDIEYEIIIIEPGFNAWLQSVARPEGFYSQQLLEQRNWQYVISWNQRVRQPQVFNSNLYEMLIDYDPNIDYGYEVNYKLYYYFVYFQLKYNQKLTGMTPRI